MNYNEFLEYEKIASKVDFLKEQKSFRTDWHECLSYHFMNDDEKKQFKDFYKQIVSNHIEKLKPSLKINRKLYKQAYEILVHIHHIENDVYFTEEEKQERKEIITKWKNEKIEALKKEIEVLLKGEE